VVAAPDPPADIAKILLTLMPWLACRAIELRLLGALADVLAGPGLSTDTAGWRRYFCRRTGRPDHLAAGFVLQPFRQITSRRIGVRLRSVVQVSIIDGYVAVDIGDMRVVRRMATVADLAFNHRDQWFVGVVLAVTFAHVLGLYGPPSGCQLRGTQPTTDMIRIVAAKEPATIAVPEFLAFSI
jgi:hypothetical protein